MKQNKVALLSFILIVGLLLGINYTLFNSEHSENKIFYDIESFKQTRTGLPEKHDTVCLVAVGDIMLSRYVAQKVKEHTNPGYPFANISQFLQGGDITFGNLENPITPGRDIKVPEMILRADPCMASALKGAGFDILSLANNHLPDFGPRGVLDTMQYLENAGINHAGAGKYEEAYEPRYIEANSLRLAFLAFTDPDIAPACYSANDSAGTAALDAEKMNIAITKAAKNADFTVVYLHVGTEYALEPDKNQIYYSRLAIDAGADLVLGSHPHVAQSVEIYKGKYILHSLGNFIFDQLWSQETRESVIARICINKKGIERIEFLPVYINDDTQPAILNGWAGLEVIKKLELHLHPESIPVWDSDKETFVAMEQYVLSTDNALQEYRITHKQQYDLDNDGIPEEYVLKNGRLTVKEGPNIAWQSPEDWWIEDFFIGDATNNGKPELNLSVWKEGSFGPYKPFWVKEEDTSVKNHLFIFQFEKNEFKPVWQSSNLDCPIRHAALIDLNGDGENELVVKEGSYTDPKKYEITLWKWNGWGFSKIEYK